MQVIKFHVAMVRASRNCYSTLHGHENYYHYSFFTIESLPDLIIVTRPSRNVAIVEGSTVTITCTVESGTASTLDWYRNGMELTENGSIGIAHTSMNSVVLTLRDVTPSDNGAHTCVGITAAGDAIRVHVVVDVLSEL